MANNKWGQVTWGVNSWGDQADADIAVTGISVTTSQGATIEPTAEINTGWGGKTWGESEWGDLSGSSVILTSLSATLSQGVTLEPSAEINEGWGRLTWGENAWGVGGDVVVTGQSLSSNIGSLTIKFGSSVVATGQSLTSSQGTASISIDVAHQVTGQSLTTSVGTASEIAGGADVDVTGISLNSNSGSVTIDDQFLIEQGWGRGTWGNRAWGGNYSVIAQGQSLSASQGNAIGFTDVDVSVTGLDLLTITQGPSSIQIDNNVFILATENQLNLSLGQQSLEQSTNESVTGQALSGSIGTVLPENKTPVDVTGISSSLTLGSITLVQTTVESVTGQAATLSVGSVTPVSVYSVTTAGLLNGSMGQVTINANANAFPSGIGLTATIGSVNITAWSEINPGVNNVWTTVDRAA